MIFYITKRTGQRLRVTISDEDADLADFRWSMAGGVGSIGKYAARQVQGQTIYLHRVVALRMGIVEVLKGEGRSSGSVDHINGNKLDCRRDNLRLRTRGQQMANLNDGLRTNNTSGHRGVSHLNGKYQTKRPWMAYVQVNYKTKSLGTFATMEEAIAARRAWDGAAE